MAYTSFPEHPTDGLTDDLWHLRQSETAEAIIWIHFLMIRLWKTEQKKSPEMFERVDDSTFIEALKFVLQTIAEQTGFDFKEATIRSSILKR